MIQTPTSDEDIELSRRPPSNSTIAFTAIVVADGSATEERVGERGGDLP